MGKNYSVNSNDYKLLEEVGHGASATVYRALYLPSNQEVAVKCLDLDRCNSNLDDIRKEAQLMTLIDHPNLIKAYCSFVVDCNLWVVMPFMAEGSCLHLMKTAYPEGLEEPSIGSILKEALKALEYLHRNGHIHRDVKAGNILVDSNGEVKLGDFGVSTSMFDRGDRKRSRNTFVGTPCWMAPEMLQPGTGYDFKADIWSFGITALELAHGHAPFSKYPPMKVLLMTVQNAPPGLDYDRDKRFSKSFKEMVAMCLVKDQKMRPTAEKLLKHSFFKNAKPPVSVKKLFAGLPPLWVRVKDLEARDATQLALKKMPSAEQEAISQSEYHRGVSAWKFDVEHLKLQASLLQDEEEIQEIKEEREHVNIFLNREAASSSSAGPSGTVNDDIREKLKRNEVLVVDSELRKGKAIESDLVESDYHGNTGLNKSVSKADLLPPLAEKDTGQASRTCRVRSGRAPKSQSGPLMSGAVLSHSLSERAHNLERYDVENQKLPVKAHQVQRAPSYSGPLNLPNRASANSLSAPIKSSGGFRDSLDERSKSNLVQIKGRFSVTSENVDFVKDVPLSTASQRTNQGGLLRKSASVESWAFDFNQKAKSHSPDENVNNNVPATILMPQLQNLFQQTSIQQDLIMNLLNSLQVVDVENAPQNGGLPPLSRGSENNGNVDSVVPERERMLLSKIYELQTRMNSLTDELTAEKVKYTQLQQLLDDASASASK